MERFIYILSNDEDVIEQAFGTLKRAHVALKEGPIHKCFATFKRFVDAYGYYDIRYDKGPWKRLRKVELL